MSPTIIIVIIILVVVVVVVVVVVNDDTYYWVYLFSDPPFLVYSKLRQNRVFGRQTERTVFKLFNLGEEEVKIVKRSRGWGGGRAELILLLRTGGILHNNFPFEAHFSAHIF